MGIIYRHQKKEPLTIEEMDGNFANLEARIDSLERHSPLVEGIANVSQDGDLLKIYGTLGSLLGQVKLPKAFPIPKGKWQVNTMYRVLDWVQMKSGIYSCIQAHTSTEFKADLEKWVLVFEV